MAVDLRAEPSTVHITVGAARFRLENPTDEIDTLLYNELAYFVDGAEFSKAYRNGWDGYSRLYDRQAKTAPVGLLDRAKAIINEHGYSVSVESLDVPDPNPIDVSWRFDHDLRDYQRESVESVLSNGGGVVSLPTGAGKTVVALKVFESVRQRAIVFVHTQELLYQWADEIRDVLEVEPGVIGNDEWSEGPVTVAMMQTLDSRGTDDLGTYSVAVFDECHRTSAAETMHNVGLSVDAPLRVGLSATPWREVTGEELRIEGAVGDEAINVSAEKLIDAGHLARPEFRYITPRDYGDQSEPSNLQSWPTVYRNHVVLSSTRNKGVASTAAALARDGYTVLVSVDRLTQGHLLRFMLNGEVGRRETLRALRSDEDDPSDVAGKVDAVERHPTVADIGASFLHGGNNTAERDKTIKSFAAGDIPILISTLLGEGVDLPSINAVVLAEGGKSDTAKIQTVGRALRPANGDHAVIADVRDRGAFIGDHFEARRQAFADYYGSYGPDIGQGGL